MKFIIKEWKKYLSEYSLIKGETPQEALIREVIEETSVIMSGFDFAIHDHEKNTHYFISDKFSGNVVLNYEHADYAWVEPVRIDSEHTIEHLKKRIIQTIEIYRNKLRINNE